MRLALPFWKRKDHRCTGASQRHSPRGRRGPHWERSLHLEPLEERALLSVCRWDGGGADNLWTTAANWQGDVAPVASDDLVFEGTTRTATQNNFAAGTSSYKEFFGTCGYDAHGSTSPSKCA